MSRARWRFAHGPSVTIGGRFHCCDVCAVVSPSRSSPQQPKEQCSGCRVIDRRMTRCTLHDTLLRILSCLHIPRLPQRSRPSRPTARRSTHSVGSFARMTGRSLPASRLTRWRHAVRSVCCVPHSTSTRRPPGALMPCTHGARRRSRRTILSGPPDVFGHCAWRGVVPNNRAPSRRAPICLCPDTGVPSTFAPHRVTRCTRPRPFLLPQ